MVLVRSNSGKARFYHRNLHKNTATKQILCSLEQILCAGAFVNRWFLLPCNVTVDDANYWIRVSQNSCIFVQTPVIKLSFPCTNAIYHSNKSRNVQKRVSIRNISPTLVIHKIDIFVQTRKFFFNRDMNCGTFRSK